MKTPIEKASAVRSGGSSIASRRRNVERNISRTGTPACWICLYHSTGANRRELIEALQCFGFVFVDVEDGKQLGDYQQILNSIWEI